MSHKGTKWLWVQLSVYAVCLSVFVFGCFVCRQWGHWCWKMCPHFFFFSLWRWTPLATMLGFPDVTHVSLWNIQLRNNSVARSKWLIYSLHFFSPFCLRVCVTLLLSLTRLLTVGARWTGNFLNTFFFLDYLFAIGPLQSPQCGFITLKI